MKKKLLITGGAGFIGSHVVRRFVKHYPDYRILNLDKLTYAGNLENLRDLEQASNYQFIHGDILDGEFLAHLLREERIDGIIHLAAESHVDRSLENPAAFALTNPGKGAWAISVFITFLPMKFMALWDLQAFSRKLLP